MAETREILLATGRALENLDVFIAKGLKYEQEIYLAPGITWLEGGAPLEVQIIDGGDQTIDRDGSVRRAQIAIIIAVIMRRPTQFESQHATILTAVSDDLQTYSRAIRAGLEQNFLTTTLIIGDDPQDLLVRPLVYLGGSQIQTRSDYPDLCIKALRFSGGMNDALS